MNMSLYEEIGGMAAVETAVAIFYEKIMADTSVNRFFRGIDMEQQQAKLRDFLIYAFGGPKQYSGRELRDAHAHFVEDGLNEAHFSAVATHLKTTLEQLTIRPDLIEKALKIVEGTRADVLGL